MGFLSQNPPKFVTIISVKILLFLLKNWESDHVSGHVFYPENDSIYYSLSG